MLNPRCDSTLPFKFVAAVQQADELRKIKPILKAIIAEENDSENKNLQLLQDYAKQIHHWNIEIEAGIRSLDEEIVYQIEKKNYLRKAIATLKIVRKINCESFLCRSMKSDGDNEDEVNDELKKEKWLIEEVNEQFEFGLFHLQDFIEKMKTCKSNLELIWSSKIENYNIECDNINLSQSSGNIMLKYGATRSVEKDLTYDDWENKIMINLNLMKKLLSQSHDTHKNINDTVLAENQRQLRKQAQQIDICLAKKKSFVENYIDKLTTQLKSTMHKQKEIEHVLENVQETRKNLQKSLKLIQTRLYNRQQKPLKEQFVDKAQNGLLTENENIEQQKLSLEKKITELEDNLKQLISVRIAIEHELQLKLNNLWIDSDQCQRIRNLYPSAINLSGY